MKQFLLTILIVFIFAIIATIPIQYKPSSHYLNPIGWIIIGVFVCIGVIIAIILAVLSSEQGFYAPVMIVLFGGFGALLGYKSVPVMLHQFSDSEVVSAEITITDSDYSHRNEFCRTRLTFEVRDGLHRDLHRSLFGNTLCVRRQSSIRAGSHYTIYGEYSWVGTQFTHLEQQIINRENTKIVISSPYSSWLLIACLLLILYLYSKARPNKVTFAAPNNK